MTRVVILTGGHLCHNPRVLREATALGRAGYAVEVLGAWFDSKLRARDRELLALQPFAFTPVLDLTRDRVAILASRVRAKLGHVAFRFGGYENELQFGFAAPALRRAARARTSALYIAHSESGLLAVRALLGSGQQVGVDMEDWFSEDLLPEIRKHRPVRLLRELEREVLQHATHASCPSQAMSAALAAEYDCPPPIVIYNAFPWSDRMGLDGIAKDRRDRAIPSIHWYSQTLGEGRGLEDLFSALPLVKHEAEVHLRGNPASGFDGWLSARAPVLWRDRIFVHPLVPNDELLSRIAEHDIGFAGEMKYSRSKDLTVSNKMLHYLLAGLAVVASDTSGQQEIARQAPDGVLLYRSGDSAALAAQLNALLASKPMMQRAKAAALRAAEHTFCWERQEGKLLDAVARALATPAGRAQQQ